MYRDDSMRIGIPFLLLFSIGFVLVPVVSSQQAETKPSRAGADSALSAKIIRVDRPLSVTIMHKQGPPFTSVEKAPEKQEWLHLWVTIANPKSGTWLPANEILVIDESTGPYPAFAVAIGAPIGSDYSFNLFKEAGDFTSGAAGHMGPKGGIVFILMRQKEEPGISLQAEGPLELHLLFAVPVAAKRLSLQIQEPIKIPVPAK
jgi:hypothetical protein